MALATLLECQRAKRNFLCDSIIHWRNLGTGEIFGYLHGSITFRNFASGVNEKRFISGSAKRAEERRGSDLAKMMKLFGERRVILVRAKFRPLLIQLPSNGASKAAFINVHTNTVKVDSVRVTGR